MGELAKSDLVIVGAGIIGLATANYLRQQSPDVSITVIEKEAVPGVHQTGHNSGVIHAGIYYAPGSLKSKLCVKGAAATKAFCQTHDIPFDTCGKLIVATSDAELPAMATLEDRARSNGLDIQRIGQEALHEMEPDISGVGALLSPASGIVNYGEICRVLRQTLEADGVAFQFNTNVIGLNERDDALMVETEQGTLDAGLMIACAGLHADRIAALSGLANDFRIVPFRGEYFRVADTASANVNHLIYPVPDPSLPFLGVHLTKMIGGYDTVGPNAMVSLGRETYTANRPHLRDMATSARFGGFWKLMMRNLRPGLHELHGSLSKATYLKRCQKYCPSLTSDDLLPYPPGIRAQAVSADGRMIEDFMIRETPHTVHVCNAPSPAATSAFPIGEEIGARALAKLNQ